MKQFEINTFKYFGICDKDCETASQVLCSSDIRGIDSHGIARLYMYFRLLCIPNAININPKIKIIHEMRSVCTMDGDNGLGLVVGPMANNHAIKLANKYGSGWVSVQNSNHFGIAGYYSFETNKHNMIGICMTNATPDVAPTFGRQAMLGTNPISFSFPTIDENNPILMDMSTSTVTYGKIEEYYRQNNKEMPFGWMQDKHGNDCNDASKLIKDKEGYLMGLGYNHHSKTNDINQGSSSHKGYCLASIVDILCGVLSGANWGPFVPSFNNPEKLKSNDKNNKNDKDDKNDQNDQNVQFKIGSVGKGRGHFFGALNINGFQNVQTFKNNCDKWRTTMQQCPTDGYHDRVLTPGEPEYIASQQRQRDGIPIKDAVWNDLTKISKYCNIDMPTFVRKNK